MRFVYSPMSFKLGLYVSFLADDDAALLLLLYWAWGRYYRPEIDANDVQRVAKNSLVPMALSLTNKAIDFAFAMLYVRILGPAGTGNGISWWRSMASSRSSAATAWARC